MKKIFTLIAVFLTLMAAANEIKEVTLANDAGGISTITIYHPDNPNGMTAIMCPGGGYANLASGHEGHDMANWFNNMGITYVVLKYRMPQNHIPYPMIDANAAIAYMREHAAEWGLNPEAIGIMGASAGGNLASYVATHNNGTPTHLNFQVLFYPVISMDKSITHGGTRYNLLGENPAPAMVNNYSNELQVSTSTPMAFLMHSSDDGLVVPENTIRYFQALIKNNVPVEMHIYPKGGHGWGFKDDFPYKAQWTESLEYWLKNVVLPSTILEESN